MKNTGKLRGKTLFITGGSRGIGKAIAIKAAKDGANVVIAAKTVEPHPMLPDTIYSAVREVEKAGGKGLACIVDVGNDKQVEAAIEAAGKEFGGIDIVVNNAAVGSYVSTEQTDMKTYDLVNSINARGTFLVSKLSLPYLKKSSHAHILNISPPLNAHKEYFKNYAGYSISKFGMTLLALGMYQEFAPYSIAVNTLWPKSPIYTANIELTLGAEAANYCRKPEIMADAAYAILIQNPKPTGEFCLDEDVLRRAGVTNFDQYLVNMEYKDNLALCHFEDDSELNKSLLEMMIRQNLFRSGL